MTLSAALPVVPDSWVPTDVKPLPGVSGYVQVRRGVDFSGAVQMNPVMSVAALAAAASSAGD